MGSDKTEEQLKRLEKKTAKLVEAFDGEIVFDAKKWGNDMAAKLKGLTSKPDLDEWMNEVSAKHDCDDITTAMYQKLKAIWHERCARLEP